MIISVIPNGDSPIALQNLASHVLPTPIHPFNNPLAIAAYNPL